MDGVLARGNADRQALGEPSERATDGHSCVVRVRGRWRPANQHECFIRQGEGTLAADPRACLIVDLETPPYGYVRVDATATIVDEPDLTLRVAREVCRRYMG